MFPLDVPVPGELRVGVVSRWGGLAVVGPRASENPLNREADADVVRGLEGREVDAEGSEDDDWVVFIVMNVSKSREETTRSRLRWEG